MTSLDPVGVSAAAKALQEWTQTIRNLRATDERLREALLSDAAVEAAAMTYEPDTFIGDAPNADDALRDARAALASLIPVAEDGADGIYTDGLHDAWRLTVRRAKRDDLIKPVSGSSEPRKETT